MNCTSSEHYGAFNCVHCLVEALIRCRAKNKAAFSAWGAQLQRENPAMYEQVKLILKGGEK